MPPIDFSLSVLYFLLTNSPHPTSAAPLLHDNTTRTDNGSFAPAWMKEPTGRGTPSMLINAFMTIALCVYTVLHMNTLPNMSAMRCILYQVKCVLIATFLPEIVLFGAYVDRIDAHRFHKEWCKRRGVEPESPEDTLGITGAFFVCMGGYSLGKSEDYEKFANMVTPNGLLFLIENGFVPAHLLRKRAIHDKNKACVWSKLLVFLQAIWILVKCVGRKNSGLPITLLEQHISLQVIFTLITHALWWNKPQNVTDPIPLVTDTELADLLVVMLFAKSTGELRYLQLELAPPTAISDECSKAEGSYDKEAVAPKFRIHTTGDRSTRRPVEEPVEKIYFFPRAGYVHRTSKLGKYGCRGRTITADSRDALRRGEIIITPDETITFGERLEVCYQSKLAGVIVLNKADIDNLLSMAEGVKALKHRRVVAALAGLEQADYERKAPLLRHRAEMICTDAYPVPKPPKSLGRTVRRLVRLLVMMLVSTVYGGWHLVAWNAHFPTPIERLLWRVASVIVAAIPPIVHVYLTRNRQKSNGKLVKKIVEKKLDVLCARMFDWTGYKLRLGDPISSLLLSIWNGFCWFVMALLISGRLFIVIESFLSVRHLTASSFETTSWEDIGSTLPIPI